MEGLKKELKNIQKALLTGTSYMMPLVVAGGILFSFSLLGGDATSTGIVVANSFMANLKIIGAAGLSSISRLYRLFNCRPSRVGARLYFRVYRQ